MESFRDWIMDDQVWNNLMNSELGELATEHTIKQNQGGQTPQGVVGSSTVGRRTHMKTDQAQLESQRRWRIREKMRVQDLQAELESKAAIAAELQAANAALRRKQTLLEAVVSVRDDQLKTLQREARQRTMERASSSLPLATALQHFDVCNSAPTSQMVVPSPPDAGQGCESASKALTSSPTEVAAVSGAWLHTAPSAEEPIPKLQLIPPHTEWSADWIERLRQVTVKEWQGLWVELVKEVSMHVLSAEAHGPGSHAHERLTQVVSRYLGIVDRITLLAPHVYYESLSINLSSGEKQDPPRGHWTTVARAINVTPSQVRECITTLDAFDQAMEPVVQERAKLAAKLARHNTPGNSTSNLPLLAEAKSNTVGGTATGSSIDPAVNTGSSATAAMQTVSAAEGTPAVVGGAVATRTHDAALGPSEGSVSELVQLLEQLSSNLARQHAAHNTVSDFLCTRVLTVVQLARAAAVSWPWLPDVTQILREGVAVLVSDEQQGSGVADAAAPTPAFTMGST